MSKGKLAKQIEVSPPKQTRIQVKGKKLAKELDIEEASRDRQGVRKSSLPLERRKNLERGGKLKKQTKNKYPRAGSSW